MCTYKAVYSNVLCSGIGNSKPIFKLSFKLFLMLCKSKAPPTESSALIPTDEVKYSVLNPLKPRSI